jgi:hypothetical protein
LKIVFWLAVALRGSFTSFASWHGRQKNLTCNKSPCCKVLIVSAQTIASRHHLLSFEEKRQKGAGIFILVPVTLQRT